MKLAYIPRSLGLTALVTVAFTLASPIAMANDTTTKNTTHLHLSSGKAKPGYTRVAAKKTSSGISFQYKLLSVPKVGEPLRISVIFDGATSPNGASAEMKADQALSMATPFAAKALAKGNSKQAQASNTHEITVTPQAEGLFFVNVFTEQEGRTGASAIAIRVGDKPLDLPTVGTLKTDANGEKVISMPAK
jgi:hypothetical protein